LTILGKTCRLCVVCEVLITHEADVSQLLVAAGVAANDAPEFCVLGTADVRVWRAGLARGVRSRRCERRWLISNSTCGSMSSRAGGSWTPTTPTTDRAGYGNLGTDFAERKAVNPTRFVYCIDDGGQTLAPQSSLERGTETSRAAVEK